MSVRDDITSVSDWVTEAMLVMGQWDRCYQALPGEVKDRSLGRMKSDVVLEYIRASQGNA